MRSSISIASKRLRVEAVELVASLPKHSIKPGRTSPFFWTSDSAVMDESLIGLARLDVAPPLTSATAIKTRKQGALTWLTTLEWRVVVQFVGECGYLEPTETELVLPVTLIFCVPGG